MAKLEKNIVPRVPTSREIGTTGLHEFDGVLHEEILRALQWPNGMKVYREMSDNDPIVGAMLFAVEMLIRGVKWDFTPNESGGQASEEGAEFARSLMEDMEKPWSEVINDILSFIPFGFSVHELVYKRRNGKNKNPRFNSKSTDGFWGWRKLPVRAQDTIEKWVFDENDPNYLIAVEQLPPQGNIDKVTIPRDRFLLFRVNSRKDNPESRSALRNAYRPWFFKRRIEELEAIGIERDLAGLPVAFLPPSYMDPKADQGKKEAYRAVMKIVTSVRNNEQAGVVFPMAYDENGNKLFDFKLLGRENGSGKAFDTESVIQRYNSNIAQTMLADFILLGQQSVGSFALSSNKTQLFSAAIGAWLTSIADVFNGEALPRLWELNSLPVETMPTLSFSDIEKRDLETVSNYFSKLVSSGALVPDEDLENWLRKQADAPERDANSELLPDPKVTNADSATASGTTPSGGGGAGAPASSGVSDSGGEDAG